MKAYITNLHAYNAGELRGVWADFPMSEDDFQEVLEDIGVVQGTMSEEWFVTDYEFNLPIDWKKLGEYPGLDVLNAVGEVDKNADYDHDVDGLRNFCYDHGQEQVIQDIVDDDLITEMVVAQVQSDDFHWSQLIFFLPESAYYDQYKINGYGNIVPLESDDVTLMWDEAVDNVIDDAIR